MSLSSNLVALISRVGAEFKSIRSEIDAISRPVFTTTSSSLVAAGIGTKTFITDTQTNFAVGMYISALSDLASNQISLWGTVTAVGPNSVTMFADVSQDPNQNGPDNIWVLSLSGKTGEKGNTGQNAGQRLDFVFPGTLLVQAGVLNQVSPNYACTISEILLYANSGPTGSNIIVDVKVNGSSIFQTPANRPFIAPTLPLAYSNGTGLALSLPARSRVTVDVVQVGSGSPGANLSVAIVFART